MSAYSKVPFIHDALQYIPYPGASWNEVITTYPSFSHLHWTFFFAILSAILQIICYTITKLFAPYLIGYSSVPPFPKKIKLSKNCYTKLGEACNYTQPIDLKQYDFDELSAKYTNNKLTPKEVEKYLKFCNKHHAETSRNEKRFQECLYPIFTKSITLGFGIYAVYDKEWLYDRALFYKGWPYHQQLDCCIPDIKLLYIMHIGWYIYKLFAQTFLDRHLRDFMASLIHHCTTIALMSLSYTNGLVRVGVAVLLLHDPSDICLQSAKLCRLIHQQLLMNIAFTCLVLSWFLTRIVIYPYHCVLSGFIDAYEQNEKPHIITICCVLMCALYVLHLHWFWMIIQAVIRALSGKGVSDKRSDSDNDSDSEVESDSVDTVTTK